MRAAVRVLAALALLAGAGEAAGEDIRQLIESHAGSVVQLPVGTHQIDGPIRIGASGTEVHGPATIIQTNPDAGIFVVEGADFVRLEGLTLLRPKGATDTAENAIRGNDADNLILRNLVVRDTRSAAGAVRLENCSALRVESCEIVNYKRISVDDRTTSELYGYAFHSIDGTGIYIEHCEGAMILDNRISDYVYLPSMEVRDNFGLGQLTEGKKPTKLGELANGVKNNAVQNWHQGSALVITGPTTTSGVQVRGNYLENAAQGIDIHGDHVICSDNIVDHCFIGLKAMHGARNVTLANNIVKNVDLWGIVMNPGAGSHGPRPASEEQEERPANYDRGNLIIGNIVTDFGYGHEYWNWGGGNEMNLPTAGIALFEGQLAENQPLRDVLVVGNMVYNRGRDGFVREGEAAVEGPRYDYAVYVGTWGEEPIGDTTPRDVTFRDNLFEPGASGVSNKALH